MCEWCVRFAKTAHSVKWTRHLQDWGWGYWLRSVMRKRRNRWVKLKQDIDKPEHAEKFKDRLWVDSQNTIKSRRNFW